MAEDQTSKQVQTTSAPGRGSSARTHAGYEVANDESTLIVRNPGADGSPAARATAQVANFHDQQLI